MHQAYDSALDELVRDPDHGDTALLPSRPVEEIITLSRQAMESEDNHPELLVPFFGFALLVFFAYCYPIARLTIALEKRYAVKL